MNPGFLPHISINAQGLVFPFSLSLSLSVSLFLSGDVYTFALSRKRVTFSHNYSDFIYRYRTITLIMHIIFFILRAWLFTKT